MSRSTILITVKKTFQVVLLGSIIFWLGSPVWAQDHTQSEPQEEKAPHVHPGSESHQEHTAHQGHPDHQGHAAHGYHPNEIALFLGGTYESEEEESFFTIGGEYQRLFTPRAGISAAFEHIHDVDALIVVGTFTYRPFASLKLTAGPGLELKSRRPGEHGGEEEPGGHTDSSSTEAGEGNDSLFLWRFGVGYVFELGERFSLTPGVSIDLVREEGHWVSALVFGATFGVGF
jgi:hypothetical protein